MVRNICFFQNYFTDFYFRQPEKVQEKFDYVLELIRQVDRVPEKFLKYVSGTKGLYEIRVEYQSNIYRVFCFFGEKKLIILLNGFQKKTGKTPKKEISKAEKLKKQYFHERGKENE